MKPRLIPLALAALLLAACRPQASKPETAAADAAPAPRTLPKDTLPESDTVHIYTYKELEKICNELNRRWEATHHTPAGRNCAGFGIGAHTIHIRLMVNTPEWQSRFRREVMDSPAFTFEGHAVLPELARTAPSDTLGVWLLPERVAWPDTARHVRFLLCNVSGNAIGYGGDSDVAFLDAGGTWRRMPVNYSIADLLYGLDTDAATIFTQTLYPDVCPLGPGTHRYFHDVRINGTLTTLMATFRLTDTTSTPAAAELTPIPQAVLKGMDEDEWRKRMMAQNDADQARRVDMEPAFPGGEEALRAYLRAHPVTHRAPKGAVTVQVTVCVDGRLEHAVAVRPLHTEADSLAVRLVEQMPRWQPAVHNGVPVRWRTLVVVPVGSTSGTDTLKH